MIEFADRIGNMSQSTKLKAELLEFQKSNGYIGAIQLVDDERLIGSSSALIDVIIEQVKAQKVKIRLCKARAKDRAEASSNLTDVDLLHNQNLTSMSKLANSLAPGTVGMDYRDIESEIVFDENYPDTFPINIDARLYEVRAF